MGTTLFVVVDDPPPVIDNDDEQVPIILTAQKLLYMFWYIGFGIRILDHKVEHLRLRYLDR